MMEEYYYNLSPERRDTYGYAKARRHRRNKRHKRRKLSRKFVTLLAAVFLLATCMGLTPVSTVLLHAKGCPDDIIQVVKAHPSTFWNALHFSETEVSETSIDISEEVVREDVPNFQQWDKRWGYGLYGSGHLAANGCGPTCLSMIYCSRTNDLEWNPLRMAEWSNQNGYYVDGVGTEWKLMDEGAQKLGLSVQKVTPSEDEIVSALYQGKAIICIMGRGNFTSSGHYIVLSGITDKGRVIVNDPNSHWRSFRKWDAGTIASQAQQMWIYD